MSGKLYLLFCLFIFGCSLKCIPLTSWPWGRATFSDFPIFDFKTSFLSAAWPGAAGRSGPGTGLASSVRLAVAGAGPETAAWPGTSGAPLWPATGLRPPSRLGRCCWYWWKRLGSWPARLARTFFFRRFFGAARGVPPAVARLQLGRDAGARGWGLTQGPSPPRK